MTILFVIFSMHMVGVLGFGTPGQGPMQIAGDMIANAIGEILSSPFTETYKARQVHPDPNKGFNCGQHVNFSPEKPYSPGIASDFFSYGIAMPDMRHHMPRLPW